MIAAEMKNGVSTVRIHDEFYVKEAQEYMKQLNRIVTDSYKRRAAVQMSSIYCHPDGIDNRA